MGTGDQARPSPETCPVGSDGLRALVAAADRCSTRDTAVLEGALRCGVRPTSLPAECFHTATGWAEHGDLDGLAFCLESGGDVEQVLGGAGHVLVFCCVAIVPWKGANPSGEFLEHLIHLGGVDPSIHPASAVWSHLAEVVLKRRDEGIVADPLTEATCLLNVLDSESVHGLFVVDPEAGVPGLIVGPSVEGVLLGHGPGGRGHVVLFVWYTAIVGHGGSDIRRAVPVRHPSQRPPTHPHRLAPSGWARHQGSLARSSCRP